MKQILVIDDDAGIRDIVRFSLIAVTDWDVLTAASGEEGLTIAYLHQPDAILLDMTMPSMDGAMTFEQLQVNEQTCNIPTILLTAKTSPSEQLLKQGIRGWIVKPFKAKSLAAQIRAILHWQ